MEKKTSIQLELSTSDNILEWLGWLGLIALWVYTLIQYSSLPDTLPTHVDQEAEIVVFGKKSTLLILPVIGTLLFVVMTALNRFPLTLNYPAGAAAEHALKRLSHAVRLIRYLKLAVVLIFFIIVYISVRASLGNSGGHVVWILPIATVAVFLSLTFFILSAASQQKKEG